MSIRIMTRVWDIDLPDSQKIVLLALADCANDEGLAWPSMASLARKCSKGERTVQGVIKDLVAAGHMTRHEVPGRGCRYVLHPRSDCTPAATAPPQGAAQTPAATAGHPRSDCGQTVKEPSRTVKGGAAADLIDGKVGELPNPAPRTARAKVRPHPLPEDWSPPPHADLSPAVQALVYQWPRGAYEAVCETFRLHWLSETRAIGRKVNWLAALGKWLANDHAKVMRDAKAGVSFAALAPARTSAARTAPAQPTPAKAREDQWSASLHAVIKRELGEATWSQWFEPTALLMGETGADDIGVTVIASSEFQRGWIEERHTPLIRKAAKAVVGTDPRWVRYDVERAPAQKMERA